MAAGSKLVVTIGANIEALKAALALGQQELIKTTAGATALASSLNGQKLEQSALQMAVAIKAVGGAATLTAAEARKAEAIFDAWFEKAAKRGAAIPADLKKIADETKAVAKATEDVAKATEDADGKHKSWFATIAGGTAAGHLLAEGLIKAGEMALDVFKEVAKWLGEIALEGSRELGIEKAFKRLTAQVGQDAVKLLHDLQKATHGTIEESALMVRVNENLAAGMKLTNDQYATLAQGAFALSKATGIDVKEALDKMSDAMITGRTRAVALLTGKIDAKDAEEKFAAALGRTADELSAEGKIEATRQAILDAVGKTVNRLGEQTDGLGTKVKQAKVAWKDFQDELGKVVAGSPVLMTLLDNIGLALSKAFGIAKEELVRRLGMAIDEVAISAVGLAATVAPVIGIIGTEFNALQVVARNVIQFLDLMLLGIKQIALAGVEAIDEMMPGAQMRDQQIRLRTDIAALRIEMLKRKDAMDEDKKAEEEWWNLGERLKVQLSELQAKMEASRRSFDNHKEAATEHAAAADADAEALKRNTDAFFNNGNAAAEHAKKLKSVMDSGRELATAFETMFRRGASGEEMFKALGGGAAGLQKAFDELATEVPADFKWIVDSFREMGEQIERDKTIEAALKNLGDFNRKTLEGMVKDTEALAGKQRDAINKAFTGNLDVQIKAQNDLAKLEQDSLEKRLGLIHTDMEARRSALDKNSSNYKMALATIDQLEEASAANATRAWEEHVQEVAAALPTLGNAFKSFFNEIPGLIEKALTGTGDIGNAITASFSNLGSKLMSNLMGSQAIGGKLVDWVGSTFGGKAASWLAGAIPGIGGAIGTLLGPVMDKVWGALTKAEGRKVNDMRDQYIAAAGGFDKLVEQARKAGVELSSNSAFQRAHTVEEWNKAVADLDAKLKESVAKRKAMMDAAMANERLATKAFIDEMIALGKAGGEGAKEAQSYFAATLGHAASGLTTMFAGLAAGATAAAQAAAVKMHMAAGMTEADAKKAAENITGIFVKSQAQASGLGAAIAATFSKMVENGSSFKEALDAIKGPLDTLRKQLQLTGFQGGDAFENLSRMGEIASGTITGPLVDAIIGANDALKGLANSGILDQEMFAGLALTATDAYNQIIAQGVDGQAALQMMQPTLQTIWELQQQFGYEVDAATQALIDQAVEAGTVGEAHMSAAERTARSMERVATIMEGIARKMGVELPAAAQAGADGINRAFDRVDPSVPPPWDGWGPPPDLTIEYSFEQVGEGPPGAGGMASGGVVYAASGATIYAAGGWEPKGSDIVPAMLTPGERVLTVGQNYDYENRMRTNAPAEAPVNVAITIQALDPVGLKKVVETQVVPLLVSAYRRNVNGARTDTRKELVE